MLLTTLTTQVGIIVKKSNQKFSEVPITALDKIPFWHWNFVEIYTGILLEIHKGVSLDPKRSSSVFMQ